MDFSENTTEAAFLPALLRRRLGGKKQEKASDVAGPMKGEKALENEVQVTDSNGSKSLMEPFQFCCT